MNISVLYNKRKYKFCDIAGTGKWVDDQNIIVPIILSNELRKQAIAEGFDSKIFNTKKIRRSEESDGFDNFEEIEEAEERVAKVKTRSRKGSVTGGINLASLTPSIGDDKCI